MSNHSQRSLEIPRRSFMTALAVGASVTTRSIWNPRQVTAAESKPWRLRLSASSINFQQLPIEQACRHIAELGFQAIDIWSAHDGCPHLDDVLNRLGPEGLQRVLKEQNLKLFSFSVYRGGYPRYAQLLGQVGGGVAVRGSERPCDPQDLIPRMRKFLNGMQAEIELAEKHDSYVAIENHGHALLDSLDSFKAFVDMNRSPRLGIALAPYHLQTLNVSVEEVIGICGRQLLFFYAWQRDQGMGQLPGHGPTDCCPWITSLAKAKYGGYVNPFMHGDVKPQAMSQALAKSREYLVSCDGRRKVSRS